MNVLINYIGPWSDKGEAAMLLSIKNSIISEIPNATIIAEATSFRIKKNDTEHYEKYGIKLIPGFLQDNHTNINIKRFFVLIKMVKLFIWLIFFKYGKINFNFIGKERETIDVYIKSDWIIVCGGQNFVDKNWGTIVILYIIGFCKLLNKPIMIWANSIGPFKNIWIKFSIKRILSYTDLITTREENSLEFMKEQNLPVPLYLTADAAFTIPCISKEESLKLLSNYLDYQSVLFTVGITAIKDFLPVGQNREITIKNYSDVMAKSIDYLIENYNADVIFFPHNIDIIGERNDLEAANIIYQKVINKSKVLIIKDDFSPEQLKGMYGCMDLFIGTRCHSCIFSSSMLIPTIAINYDSRGHKTQSIMKMMGIEKYVCDINNVTFDEIKRHIDEIYLNKDTIVKILKERIEIVHKMSDNNIILAKKYLNNS